MTAQTSQSTNALKTSQTVSGSPLNIGQGFTGLGFRHKQYSGAMDPMIMVDHYTMTAPTFGAHAHAGISAVSVLFEDTEGKFNNRDSLGNDFDIQGGDLYWLNAGSGALHDEAPRPGAKVHGLQIFVNLPARLKHQAPSSLHVKRENMPTLEGQGYRVRLVLGHSNNVVTDAESVWPFTILDGYADKSSTFEHQIEQGYNTWLYAVEGAIEFQVSGEWVSLAKGESITISEAQQASLKVRGNSGTRSHFAVLSGETINESFVQQGPFAMSTQEEINEVVARYEAGELGQLS
ncbi:pirin family protein [Paraglaciecola sp.]|uniref:pirin family protein n=1 Tax=Paraglaciecola sp. TaxID=1920173 RepID=UPI003EF20EEB